MIFVAYWMFSLGVWIVVMAGWWGVAMTFGIIPLPTAEQTAGCGWLLMALSQVAALVTIILISVAEDREMKRHR